jgi:hypothetical protein
MTKSCRICNIVLSPENTPKNCGKICKPCNKILRHDRHQIEKEYNNSISKEFNRKLKQDLVTNYGGKCECCGETRIEFLTIDHINNDGYLDRKEKGNTRGVQLWLRRNGYPKDNYRLLCYNCNCASYFRGSCHGEEIKHEKQLKLFIGRNNHNTIDKICYKCGSILTNKNWYASTKKENRNLCISCKAIDRKALNYADMIRVLAEYGGICQCCGENKIQLLTIDHINNDGAEHRKINNIKGGTSFYRWIVRNNFPKDILQILCFNCNCSKGFLGYCPHSKE